MKKKSYLLFFIICAVFTAAASFAHPVTPTLIIERGLDSSLFGTATAAVMVTMFLVAPFYGKLCSYIPTRKIMLFCGFGYAVGQAIFGMAYSSAMVFAGRMFAGIFTGGSFVAFSNYIINTCDPDKRGQNLTVLVTIQTVASAGGYFVGGMLGIISVEAAFIAQCICLALCGVLFYMVCEDDTPYKVKPSKPMSVKDVNPFSAFFAARKFMTAMLAMVFVTCVLAGVCYNSFETCFNYFIKDQFGMGSQYNGTFKAVIAVAIMAANSTITLYLQNKTNINKTVVPVLGVCTLVVGVAAFSEIKWLFIGSYIVFHVVNAIRTPMLQNIVASRSTKENSNEVMGFYQAMNNMGNMIGAYCAGMIYSAGPKLPFILATATMGLATLVMVFYSSSYKKTQA